MLHFFSTIKAEANKELETFEEETKNCEEEAKNFEEEKQMDEIKINDEIQEKMKETKENEIEENTIGKN